MLELHYPMIQFLIKSINPIHDKILIVSIFLIYCGRPKETTRLIFLMHFLLGYLHVHYKGKTGHFHCHLYLHRFHAIALLHFQAKFGLVYSCNTTIYSFYCAEWLQMDGFNCIHRSLRAVNTTTIRGPKIYNQLSFFARRSKMTYPAITVSFDLPRKYREEEGCCG